MLVYEKTAIDLDHELSRIERSRHFVYVRPHPRTSVFVPLDRRS